MVKLNQHNLISAEDGFEAFYAEKIWQLIPGIYRDEDAKSTTPDALRAFVEILATEAAVARRSVDRLWSDAGITDCDDWVIPYIADLLGTRLISEQNTAGRRADVANTINYRRRAGTLHLLEKLADDIAGWDAVAVEAYKRLLRFHHNLDCPPPIGETTQTPQGGFAKIKDFRISDTVDTAFDDVSHLPDFRRLRGNNGRYNIPKINLHVFRQYALPIFNSTPFKHSNQFYSFDPSGRDISLFMPGRNIDDFCRSARPWEVRAPIDCSLINSGKYTPFSDAAVGLLATQLLPIYGQEFANASDLLARATSLKGNALTANQAFRLLDKSLHEDSAKQDLIGDAFSIGLGPNSGAIPSPAALVGGDLSEWDSVPSSAGNWVDAVIDPKLGRIWLDQSPNPGHLFSRMYHYGQFFPIGAGSYDRNASLTQAAATAIPSIGPLPGGEDPVPGPVTNVLLPGTPTGPVGKGVYQFTDSKTYQISPGVPPVNETDVEDDLVIQAIDGQRPHLSITPDGGTANWTIKSSAGTPNLTLDGLWLGILPSTHGPVADNLAGPVPTRLIIDGDFETVTLRHMTLDPGGVRAKTSATDTFTLPHIILEIKGAVAELNIERCITGPIEEAMGSGDRCAANLIKIRDSIIVSVDGGQAILTRIATLDIKRSTVFGDVAAARVFASDTLIQGNVLIDDVQGSCFRYSSALGGAASRIPRAYRSVLFEDSFPNHIFVSRRFGDAGFAQLSATAPSSIIRGAENTSEMGVFNCALDAIKTDDLTYKLAEFTGINVITQIIKET